MLRDHLRIAFRTLRRHAGYAALNVAGLAIGLGVCLTLALYVQHEARYDRFLPGAERVVRVIRANEPGGDFNVRMPPGLAGELRRQAPAFAHATALHAPSRMLIRVGDVPYYLDDVMVTDSAFFSVFPHPFVQGDPATALRGPGRLVLTASVARRLFGSGDAVGETVQIEAHDGFSDLTVTGILADPPSHTHLRFRALRTSASGAEDTPEGVMQWNYYAGAVYGLLRPDADLATAEAQVVAVEEATNEQEWLNEQVVRLEPAAAVHLHSDVAHDLAPKSDVRYLYLFGAIGVLILAIAGINYTNLATAAATLRAREVGVRKAVGADRRQLVAQFLVEAVLLALLAVPLALALASLALPLVNRLIDAQITLGLVDDAGPLLALVGAAVGAGLIAGSYPAFYLARFRPTHVLKGRLPGLRRGHATLRRGLVVIQFAASLTLIVGTLVVYAQLRHIQTINLGFDQELVITAPTDGLEEGDYAALKAALEARPRVAAVSSGMPLGLGYRFMTVVTEDEAGDKQPLGLVDVDRGYFETLGFSVAEGEAFGDQVSAPAVVLNRSAAAHLGEGSAPAAVGQTVNGFQTGPDGEQERARVVGIVEDFHNQTLHAPKEEAFMFRLSEGTQRTLLVRLRPGDVRAALDDVAATWAQFVPERPLDPEFLDDRIAAQYRKETRLGQIFLAFAGLAALVACLGLFGLAAFAVARRTKEVGIRKVLGATVPHLVGLLSREFLILVGVAFAVAAPLAYLAMDRWLADFAYRVAVGPGVFALALGLALAVTALAVGGHAVRAARANPADTLRYE